MAASLQSLIADGHYRATSLGRDSWKSLLESQSSLQLHCNREGFNSDGAIVKTRIGTVSNEGSDGCDSCDSRIGFGGANGDDDSNTCGNIAYWYPDNGEKSIKAMGYIFTNVIWKDPFLTYAQSYACIKTILWYFLLTGRCNKHRKWCSLSVASYLKVRARTSKECILFLKFIWSIY